MEEETFQERFGARVQDLRKAAGLTQAQVAAKMVDLGFRWHHTTVAKVESGGRPTSLEEAVGLAKVLDLGALGVGRFLYPPRRHEVGLAMRAAKEAREQFVQAAERYLWAQSTLEVAIEAAEEAGEALHPAEREGGGWLDESPVTTLKRLIFDQAVDDSNDDAESAWVFGHGSVDDYLAARKAEASAAGFDDIHEFDRAEAEASRDALRKRRAQEDDAES